MLGSKRLKRAVLNRMIDAMDRRLACLRRMTLPPAEVMQIEDEPTEQPPPLWWWLLTAAIAALLLKGK